MNALARVSRRPLVRPRFAPRWPSPRTLVAIAAGLVIAAALSFAGYVWFAGPLAHPVRPETFWLAFGWAAQALFTARFLVQWLAAERAGEVVVPASFWWLSLGGGLALGVYFISRHDPVGIVGQMAPVAIYARNLFLIHRREHPTCADEPARA